jgi:hypothetical protein
VFFLPTLPPPPPLRHARQTRDRPHPNVDSSDRPGCRGDASREAAKHTLAGFGRRVDDSDTTQRRIPLSAMNQQLWAYREQDWTSTQQPLTGYSVEATDGSIGKIDEATYDVGASYVVVDTGPWIFGSKVMLPAGVIGRVDHDDETVFVSLSKDEIKNSPKFDEATYRDDDYRDSLSTYYEPYSGRESTRSTPR